MKQGMLLLLACALAAGCATGTGGTRAADPTTDPAHWRGDARLYRILLPYPISAAQRDSLRIYETDNGTVMNALLAEAASDTAAPTPVRVNALFLLAQRRADTHMRVFRGALDAEDARVRAMAVAAMREFAQTHPREAHSIARMAISDPAPEVQAQALQILADDDVVLLRAYIAGSPAAELRTVATGLVQLAEQRGAPLVGDSITGVLRRETAGGWHITFRPYHYWPQWQAGHGSVTLERAGAAPQTLTGVEAVAGVIPAFISPDGRHVVYERDRTIVVRTLADGTERVVGTGIAPRLRPFTDEFLFLREQPGNAKEQREKTSLTYEVLVVPFDAPAGHEPKLLATTDATMSFGEHGGYSPVRWMRVEERVGNFYLNGQNMSVVSLPDPFVQG